MGISFCAKFNSAITKFSDGRKLISVAFQFFEKSKTNSYLGQQQLQHELKSHSHVLGIRIGREINMIAF